MLKSISLAAAALLGVFGTGQIAASGSGEQTAPPYSAKTTLGGLSMSSSEQEILEHFGNPHSVKEGRFDLPKRTENGRYRLVSEPSKWLRYDGYDIFLVGGKIFSFQCSVSGCGTNRNVNVGDGREKVVQAYGRGDPPPEHIDADLLIYEFGDIGVSLVFVLAGERVSIIRFHRARSES